MTPVSAVFDFVRGDVQIIVRFAYGDSGPSEVTVEIASQTKRFDNRDGSYKPCATHAKDLVRRAEEKPPATEFAKQREKPMKPRLFVEANH